MRRKDKEIKDKEVILSIIQEGDHCVIALSDNNNPYMVPMNFGYQDGHLYLHSSPDGRKIEILKGNNKISFGVEIKTRLVKSESACEWGMEYMSIIGEGYAYFVEDFHKKKEAFDIIMAKYSDYKSKFEYSETALNQVVVIDVQIIKLTCKISGYE